MPARGTRSSRPRTGCSGFLSHTGCMGPPVAGAVGPGDCPAPRQDPADLDFLPGDLIQRLYHVALLHDRCLKCHFQGIEILHRQGPEPFLQGRLQGLHLHHPGGLESAPIMVVLTMGTPRTSRAILLASTRARVCLIAVFLPDFGVAFGGVQDDNAVCLQVAGGVLNPEQARVQDHHHVGFERSCSAGGWPCRPPGRRPAPGRPGAPARNWGSPGRTCLR